MSSPIAAATGYPEPVLKLRDLLNTYLEPDKVALILKAYEVAEAAPRGQTRKTGEPYIFHPVAVAQILANMRMDHDSIAAAILHDTIEDTPLSWDDIQVQFGPEIANLVEGVTKGGASAVLAASIFHFGDFTIAEAKAHMAAAGIPMRLGA